MTSLSLVLLICIIMMFTFLMLIQTHVTRMVALFIFQNIFLAIYMIGKTGLHADAELTISLCITLIIKVIILPVALWKLVHYLKASQRIDPLIRKSTLQLAGVLLIIFVLLVTHPIGETVSKKIMVSFSLLLANCMLALLLIIFRRKAISQVIGLLVMENSIFILSLTLTSGFPWVVELGIGFDILIGFMIFGLFLLRIRSTYGSLHVHHLEKLKERM